MQVACAGTRIGPSDAKRAGMTKIAFSVNRKSGVRVVHTALVPANRSEQAWFGLLDGTVIAFFVLLYFAGLALLLKQ